MINLILSMNPELKRNEEAAKALEERNTFNKDIFEVQESHPAFVPNLFRLASPPPAFQFHANGPN
jgi:hypothetical protein